MYIINAQCSEYTYIIMYIVKRVYVSSAWASTDLSSGECRWGWPPQSPGGGWPALASCRWWWSRSTRRSAPENQDNHDTHGLLHYIRNTTNPKFWKAGNFTSSTLWFILSALWFSVKSISYTDAGTYLYSVRNLYIMHKLYLPVYE